MLTKFPPRPHQYEGIIMGSYRPKGFLLQALTYWCWIINIFCNTLYPSHQTKISAWFKYNNYVSIARALIEMEDHHWLWRAIKWPITYWNIYMIAIYIDLKDIFWKCIGSNWKCTSSFQLPSQFGSCCIIMPIHSSVNSP